MNEKSKLLGRRVKNISAEPIPWRNVDAEKGKSRTVSFYVPRAQVLLWNCFVCYLTQFRNENVNRGIIRAIIFLIQNLDYEEQRKFRLAIQRVAEEDADEAIEMHDLLKTVMLPGENLTKILTNRSQSMVARRQRLFRDALKWFGVWDKYEGQFGLIDPDKEDVEETINPTEEEENGQG